VAIVEGKDLEGAVRRATSLGINPGGEVAAWPVPAEFQPRAIQFRDRLLSRKELANEDLGGEPLGEDPVARGLAQGLCACCNGAVHKRSIM